MRVHAAHCHPVQFPEMPNTKVSMCSFIPKEKVRFQQRAVRMDCEKGTREDRRFSKLFSKFLVLDWYGWHVLNGREITHTPGVERQRNTSC